MSLTPGTTVGRYHVRDLLGSGGMGDVYKAQDPTLGRWVAIKVLKATLSADADRVTRFLQEARAASALNHPNILTIHEVGDHNASRFIVSEFVEGETLRERMKRGPLTLREILDVAIQTASALSAAHAAGIVHRDIKPENLMLRPDGYVKVLDFGVAKLSQPAATAPDTDPGATFASDTGVGMVVGTMAYMSPEQARGLNVDGRADGFSLGIVLYELVTGRAPFAGATPSDVLVAILDREPPPLRLHARGLPVQLEWIVAKALDKDPALRYQSIADLRVDLMRLKAAIESGRVTDAAAGVMAAPVVDQPIEVELTDDSAEVRSTSGVSWPTAAHAAVAAASIIAAAWIYDRARPGADLPLQVPEGAVVTKARDIAESLGYTGWGSETESEFENTLDVTHVAALAGLPAAREAIRAGAVGQWEVVSGQRDVDALTGGRDPQEGEYAIRLDPAGEIIGFATGVSQEPVPAADRDRATTLGREIVKRAFGADASGWDLEFLPRAFPAGTVEMTWRNPARRFGHIEQVRVHLHGEKIVRLARSFERPPGFTEPSKSAIVRALEVILPTGIGIAFVASWGFGLYVLVKTRSWDALKHRLPIAFCAIVVASVALSAVETSGDWQSLVGVIAVAIFVPGTLLPALSGLFLWIRRRNPARLWAADRLTRGRVLSAAVSASLVDGVLAGAAIAAAAVAVDLLGLQVDGFLPSISRETEAVDQGPFQIVSDAVASASFLAMGLALAVEALEKIGAKARAATLVLAAAGVFGASARHQSLLAMLPSAAGGVVIVLIAGILYRTRGFLAAWIAAAISAMLLDGMAARSLDDPALVTQSNLVFGIVAVVLIVGLWGLTAGYLNRKRAAPAAATG